MNRDKKESRGIYNVTFNGKRATPIKTDLEIIEDAVIAEVVMYVKGWHNERRDKGAGAEHIKLHLEKGSDGEISIEELLNLGNSIREYLKVFKEPYLEDKNRSGKVYEWQNKEGVRFRVATDTIKGEGLIPPLSPSDKQIITFYSDRNLKERMQFKNPKVAQYYENQIANPTQEQDSAIAKMKQKIEKIAQKGLQNNTKKDKGAER